MGRLALLLALAALICANAGVVGLISAAIQRHDGSGGIEIALFVED